MHTVLATIFIIFGALLTIVFGALLFASSMSDNVSAGAEAQSQGCLGIVVGVALVAVGIWLA